MSPSGMHHRFASPFIAVQRKSIELEDGTCQVVEPYLISRNRVTIQQFSTFCRTTGYQSIAEQRGQPSFLNNDSVISLSEAERSECAAYCLTYCDADAYCKWTQLRLPTESEWLAAAIIDDTIYSPRAGKDKYFKNGRSILFGREDVIDLFGEGYEITASVDSEGRVVARSGPKYYRVSDWISKVNVYRQVFMPNEAELFTCFRVCTDDND